MREAPNCAKNDLKCKYVRKTAESAITHPLHVNVASVEDLLVYIYGILLRGGGGGGGYGDRFFWTSILINEFVVIGRGSTDNLGVLLGLRAKCGPCGHRWQKVAQKTKI